jgi:hypothetical protein
MSYVEIQRDNRTLPYKPLFTTSGLGREVFAPQ